MWVCIQVKVFRGLMAAWRPTLLVDACSTGSIAGSITPTDPSAHNTFCYNDHLSTSTRFTPEHRVCLHVHALYDHGTGP